MVEAICGLGKEKATSSAQGWIARGVNSGEIRRNACSITLVPQKLALPVAKEPSRPQDRTHE